MLIDVGVPKPEIVGSYYSNEVKELLVTYLKKMIIGSHRITDHHRILHTVVCLHLLKSFS